MLCSAKMQCIGYFLVASWGSVFSRTGIAKSNSAKQKGCSGFKGLRALIGTRANRHVRTRLPPWWSFARKEFKLPGVISGSDLAYRGVIRLRDVPAFEAFLFEAKEGRLHVHTSLCDGDSVFSSDDGEIAWNIWNPLPTALSHYVYGLRMQDLLPDEDVGKVASSCHFVVDILQWTHTA